MMKAIWTVLLIGTVSCKSLKSNPPPPPGGENARMARYITHQSDWTALSTISVREPTVDYPFANIGEHI